MLSVLLLGILLVVHEISSLINVRRLLADGTKSLLFRSLGPVAVVLASVLKLALGLAAVAAAATGIETSVDRAIAALTLASPLAFAAGKFWLHAREPGSPCGCSVVFRTNLRHHGWILLTVGAAGWALAVLVPNVPGDPLAVSLVAFGVLPSAIALALARVVSFAPGVVR